MIFEANVNVMPKKEILDPQGKAVKLGLSNLGLKNIEDVRIGKHITMQVNTATREEAWEEVELACKKLLANLVMESYEFELKELQ